MTAPPADSPAVAESNSPAVGPTRREKPAWLEASEAQRAIVLEGEAAIPSRSRAWLDFSAEQAALLVADLRAGAGTAAVEERLLGWWVGEEARGPAFRDLTRRAIEGWVEMLVRLDATLTQGQREKALAKLDSWIRGLEGVVRDTRGT